MQKTKLGVTVGLLGAAVYFSALFASYIPVIMIAGYILLAEENEWLRKAVIKAVVLLMSIEVFLAIVSLIPDALSWINSLISIFNGALNYTIVSTLVNIISKAVDIIRTVLFLLLGIKAFNQGTITIPFVDNLINKYT